MNTNHFILFGNKLKDEASTHDCVGITSGWLYAGLVGCMQGREKDLRLSTRSDVCVRLSLKLVLYWVQDLIFISNFGLYWLYYQSGKLL